MNSNGNNSNNNKKGNDMNIKDINENTIEVILHNKTVKVEDHSRTHHMGLDIYYIETVAWLIEGQWTIFDNKDWSGYTTLRRNAEAITGSSDYNWLYICAHAALHGYTGVEKSTYVDALLYAGVHGDVEAMGQFNGLAAVGQAAINARQAEVAATPSDCEYRARLIAEAGLSEAGTEALYLVHGTSHDLPYDENGNILLRPASDWGVRWEDKDQEVYLRNTLHFTLNGAVPETVDMFNHWEGDEYNFIIVPLQTVLDANPGTLGNLAAFDTWFTPQKGRSLVIPAGTFDVVKREDVGKVLVSKGVRVVRINDTHSDDMMDTFVRNVAAKLGVRANRLHTYEAEGFSESIRQGGDEVRPYWMAQTGSMPRIAALRSYDHDRFSGHHLTSEPKDPNMRRFM